MTFETQAGAVLPDLTVAFTRETLVRYAGASGDFNPIHYSDGHARALGLDGCIAHGMLTMGVGLRLVTDWCSDPARVSHYRVTFTRPVPVPDDADGSTVHYSGVVKAVTDGVATVALEARCGNESVLGRATAEVRLG